MPKHMLYYLTNALQLLKDSSSLIVQFVSALYMTF